MSPEEELGRNQGGALLSPTCRAPERGNSRADLGRRDRQAESRENGQAALVAELSVELLSF